MSLKKKSYKKQIKKVSPLHQGLTVLVSLLSWIPRGLIMIGDAVLSVFIPLFFVTIRLLTVAAKASKRAITTTRVAGAKIATKTTQMRQPQLQLPRIAVPHVALPHMSLPSVSLPLPKRRKKQKQVVIFPLPFMAKVKFFSIGVLFSTFFVFLPLLVLIFLQDLPNPRELSLRPIPQTTKIYDRNHVLLYEIYTTQNRTLVSINEIPQHLQDATIAIEDKNFYNHPGFDVPSMIRALRENVSGRSFQGGSTLTQQLIKSSLLTPEQTISRKVKEIVLAFWAERMYTKDQILEMYFNQVPYGGSAWGVEAASETYFGKHVKDLDLAESAFLAGITTAPTMYSPYGSTPDAWKIRQKEVLKRMLALDYITKEQHDEALATEIEFQTPRTPIYAPHFVMYVKDHLVRKYGLATVEKGGLNVVTTLDLKIHDQAQKVVAEEVANAAYLNLTNGAALVTDPNNGDILAMVGSKDFNEPTIGNFNVVTSPQQPGSTVKVITYSAALSRGFTAATVLDDTKTTFQIPGAGTYTPVNYNDKYTGKVSLRYALANSLNIPAVKTLNQVSVPTMLSLAQEMGVESWNKPSDQYGLSLTLGGYETNMMDMATVFGTLANEGERVDLNPILKITDYKGDVLEEKKDVIARRVLTKGVAFIMTDILSDNNARSASFGSNSPLNIPGHRVAVKTGTTDWKKDNWAIGYTKDYVVTVWVGNNDNSAMSQSLASGITGAAPIWNRIMTELVEGKQEPVLEVPTEITQKTCLGRTEYFVQGTESIGPCTATPTPRVVTAITQ